MAEEWELDANAADDAAEGAPDANGPNTQVRAALIIALAALAALACVTFATLTLSQQPQTMTADEPPIPEANDLTTERFVVEAAVDDAVAEIQNPDAVFLATLATDLDEGFVAATGYSHGDLGVDALVLAQWITADLSYRVENISLEGDHATVELSLTMRDAASFIDAFYDDANLYFNSSEGLALDQDAARIKLGEFYLAALNETTDRTTEHLTLTVDRTGETWTVNETSWNDEVYALLTIYDASVEQAE